MSDVKSLYGNPIVTKDSHTHANKDVLDNIDDDLLSYMHEHKNLNTLNDLTQEVIDDSHKHENKNILDQINQNIIDNSHKHNNADILNKITENHINELNNPPTVVYNNSTLTGNEPKGTFQFVVSKPIEYVTSLSQIQRVDIYASKISATTGITEGLNFISASAISISGNPIEVITSDLNPRWNDEYSVANESEVGIEISSGQIVLHVLDNPYEETSKKSLLVAIARYIGDNHFIYEK